jgi:hypothetical protein
VGFMFVAGYTPEVRAELVAIAEEQGITHWAVRGLPSQDGYEVPDQIGEVYAARLAAAAEAPAPKSSKRTSKAAAPAPDPDPEQEQ